MFALHGVISSTKISNWKQTRFLLKKFVNRVKNYK